MPIRLGAVSNFTMTRRCTPVSAQRLGLNRPPAPTEPVAGDFALGCPTAQADVSSGRQDELLPSISMRQSILAKERVRRLSSRALVSDVATRWRCKSGWAVKGGQAECKTKAFNTTTNRRWKMMGLAETMKIRSRHGSNGVRNRVDAIRCGDFFSIFS